LFLFPLSRPPRRCAAGFSLVEIMVGMVIGMLGLIIMMQVFSLSESQKRTTTGGGDAQSSGAIALYGLQRDIRQAGYATSDIKMIGCNLLLRAGVTLNAMAPVTINHFSIPPGDPNTDTLLVVYGNSIGSPQGDIVTTQPVTSKYNMPVSSSFNNGDYVIATLLNSAWPCNLILDQVTNIVAPAVNVATGVVGMPNGTLFNVGSASQPPKIHAYAIRNGNLTECDYMVNDCGSAANSANATIWVPIANNIVSLKAQYGRDTMNGQNPLNTAMDGFVDWYDQTTPHGPSSTPQYAQGSAQPAPPMAAGATAPTYQCAFARISAVRLALVARNANFEKTAVTTAAPTWEGSTAHAPPNPPTVSDGIGWAANPIDLTANTGLTLPATWQNYRYKVIQTVVPLRNLAWQGVQGVPAGC
jgi:type IV pilus assembly protein PilW